MLGEQFWPRVDKSGGEDACWIWPGALHMKYGRADRPLTAFVWLTVHGSIPTDRRVIHRAGCPQRCVNPGHLSLGTLADMVVRVSNHDHKGSKKGSRWRKTPLLCRKGHPWSASAVVRKDGYRRCKVCHRIGQQVRRSRNLDGLDPLARKLLEALL